MIAASHLASHELLCFLKIGDHDMSFVVGRYLWELQLSSQEGTMHMVLLHLHRGRTGPMCPPATLLLLATALGLGETIAERRFSNFDHS